MDAQPLSSSRNNAIWSQNEQCVNSLCMADRTCTARLAADLEAVL
jgi:hypothetical protein